MPQTVPWKLRAGEETGLVTAKVISGTSLRVVQWPSSALAHAPGLLMPLMKVREREQEVRTPKPELLAAKTPLACRNRGSGTFLLV